MDAHGNGHGTVRFYLVEDEPAPLADSQWPRRPPGSTSRLAAARAALREAQQVECDERSRLSRSRLEGLTATHAALLQARQRETQAAFTAVADLNRRAAWLRQTITMGEEALARQQQFLDKLRRELAEIGE